MALRVWENKEINLTDGEDKVLKALKRAYLNVEHEVIIYVQSKLSTKRVDFIIIDANRGIAIIEVKDWSESYIEYVNKRIVKLLNRECENPNIQVKGYKNILSSGLFARNFEIDEEDINCSIIYTNMNKELKCSEKLKELFRKDINYLFEDDIKNLDINKLFDTENVCYSEEDLKKIRIILFPEIEIIKENEYKDVCDIKALDFEQEEFAKRIPLGHYMVTGIPGSGKTVILLSPAIYLIKENPQWKILILTYNKSLKKQLDNKLNKISEKFKDDINNRQINIDSIEVRHFHGEISILTKGIRKPNDIDNNTWFNEEIVEIANNKVTEQYDAILIDEYQDFRMNWIKLCIKLCKQYKDNNGNKVKNIFLCGDRLQSIYNNKDISWKSIGIDMRGRSKFLKTSYRSAKQHMQLALKFLENDDMLKSEVNKFYNNDSGDVKLEYLYNGNIEFVKGGFEFIGDKIIELKEQGYKNEDFLILADSLQTCQSIKEHSSHKIKYQMQFVKELNIEDIDDSIILTTYHSSKGLEAKVVFLTNMDKIFISNDNKDQLKRKTIYVGITRASEKLYIQEGNGKFFNEIKSIIENNYANING